MPESKQKISTRLRASCDQCHRLKLKCSFTGSKSCVRCLRRKVDCMRSQTKPTGRRRGSEHSNPAPTVQSDFPEDTNSSPTIELSPFTSSTAPEEDAAGDFFGPAYESLSSSLSEATLDLRDTLFDTQVHDLTDFTTTWTDRCNDEYVHTPLVHPNHGPHTDVQASVDFRVASRRSNSRSGSNSLSCTCFVAITCAIRDLSPDPAERDSLHHMLQQNKDGLSIVRDFLACDGIHDFSLTMLIYTFLHKITATFARALHMACESVIHVGSYTIEGEDGHALRRQIILLGVRRVKQMLGQLSLKSHWRSSSVDWWVVEQDDSIYRPICAFMHDFLRNEVDVIIRQVAVV